MKKILIYFSSINNFLPYLALKLKQGCIIKVFSFGLNFAYHINFNEFKKERNEIIYIIIAQKGDNPTQQTLKENNQLSYRLKQKTLQNGTGLTWLITNFQPSPLKIIKFSLFPEVLNGE